MSEGLIVGLVVAVALGALAVWLVPAARRRRRAAEAGLALPWGRALVTSDPPAGFYRDAARVQAVRPDVALETLEVHALAGGRLRDIAEALEAVPEADVEALCVADLMRGDPLEAARSGDAAAWLREALKGA